MFHFQLWLHKRSAQKSSMIPKFLQYDWRNENLTVDKTVAPIASDFPRSLSFLFSLLFYRSDCRWPLQLYSSLEIIELEIIEHFLLILATLRTHGRSSKTTASVNRRLSPETSQTSDSRRVVLSHIMTWKT